MEDLYIEKSHRSLFLQLFDNIIQIPTITDELTILIFDKILYNLDDNKFQFISNSENSKKELILLSSFIASSQFFSCTVNENEFKNFESELYNKVIKALHSVKLISFKSPEKIKKRIERYKESAFIGNYTIDFIELFDTYSTYFNMNSFDNSFYQKNIFTQELCTFFNEFSAEIENCINKFSNNKVKKSFVFHFEYTKEDYKREICNCFDLNPYKLCLTHEFAINIFSTVLSNKFNLQIRKNAAKIEFIWLGRILSSVLSSYRAYSENEYKDIDEELDEIFFKLIKIYFIVPENFDSILSTRTKHFSELIFTYSDTLNLDILSKDFLDFVCLSNEQDYIKETQFYVDYIRKYGRKNISLSSFEYSELSKLFSSLIFDILQTVFSFNVFDCLDVIKFEQIKGKNTKFITVGKDISPGKHTFQSKIGDRESYITVFTSKTSRKKFNKYYKFKSNRLTIRLKKNQEVELGNCQIVDNKIKTENKIRIKKLLKPSNVIFCLLLLASIVVSIIEVAEKISENPSDTVSISQHYQTTARSRIVTTTQHEYVMHNEPKSGQLLSGYKLDPDYDDCSSLTIKASSDESCFVKLKDIYGNTRLSFYVRAGDKVTVGVPRETLRVYFASGDIWYGRRDLFGEYTSYSKDSSLCDFEEYTYEYTLYPISSGNFSETPISADEF